MAPPNRPVKDRTIEGREDPWAHRSEHMGCGTCMWFVFKSGTVLGRCRKHAPIMSGYPVVFPGDWCGDHKLDETYYKKESN